MMIRYDDYVYKIGEIKVEENRVKGRPKKKQMGVIGYEGMWSK